MRPVIWAAPISRLKRIERIDELILGPMLEGLPSLGEFRLLLMPDHATPCKLKTHSNEAVPFAIISKWIFRQRATAESALHRGRWRRHRLDAE